MFQVTEVTPQFFVTVTERPRSLIKSRQSSGNGHLPYHLFIFWLSARAYEWRGMEIGVRSKDAQKHLARTSLKWPIWIIGLTCESFPYLIVNELVLITFKKSGIDGVNPMHESVLHYFRWLLLCLGSFLYYLISRCSLSWASGKRRTELIAGKSFLRDGWRWFTVWRGYFW